jgi:hypothetical protein
MVHADERAVTSGAVKQIVKFNACVGQLFAANGARTYRFAGYLKAVFIDGRPTLAATVIAGYQILIAVKAEGCAAILADHRLEIGRRP